MSCYTLEGGEGIGIAPAHMVSVVTEIGYIIIGVVRSKEGGRQARSIDIKSRIGVC